MIRRVLLVFATLLAATQMSFLPAASGSNWGGESGESGCMPSDTIVQDSDYMTWRRVGLNWRMKNAVKFSLDNHVTPTTMTVAAEHTSTTAVTDVLYLDYNYTNYCLYQWHGTYAGGILGLAECKTLLGQTCEQFEVRFDTSFTLNAGNNNTISRSFACHETGHTLGLRHRETTAPNDPDFGCMTSGNIWYGNYTAHDRVHINGYY